MLSIYRSRTTSNKGRCKIATVNDIDDLDDLDHYLVEVLIFLKSEFELGESLARMV